MRLLNVQRQSKLRVCGIISREGYFKMADKAGFFAVDTHYTSPCLHYLLSLVLTPLPRGSFIKSLANYHIVVG